MFGSTQDQRQARAGKVCGHSGGKVTAEDLQHLGPNWDSGWAEAQICAGGPVPERVGVVVRKGGDRGTVRDEVRKLGLGGR